VRHRKGCRITRSQKARLRKQSVAEIPATMIFKHDWTAYDDDVTGSATIYDVFERILERVLRIEAVYKVSLRQDCCPYLLVSLTKEYCAIASSK
jgi:hypothetical protein